MSGFRFSPRLWIAAGALLLAVLACNAPGEPAQPTEPSTQAPDGPTGVWEPLPVTPTSAVPTGPTATTASNPGVPPPQGPTHRITFEQGGVSATVQGTATAAERVTYVISAMRTQTMTVRLTSSGKLGLGVVGPGAVLQDSMDGKPSWTGVLELTGDYILFVQTMDGKPAAYSLEVSIPPPPAPTATTGHACNVPAAPASAQGGASWSLYCNAAYGFGFRYPGTLSNSETMASIALPFAPGTNLVEKLLAVMVKESVSTCSAANASPYQANEPKSETATFNGVTFQKQSYGGVAAGSVYQSITYSALHGSTCVGMTFTLHWGNLGVYSTPPPAFDEAAESAVFDQIMATFSWPGN